MHDVNARHLTVRNLPEDVAAALLREKRRRGTSLNQTVVDLLRLSLGLGLGVVSVRSNGLRRLAGSWTEAEHREFLSRVQVFETIDADLWK
jgi:plasmid stability protein